MVQKDEIIKLLREKSVMKQDVYNNTFSAFKHLKKVVKQLADDLKREMKKHDERVIIEYGENGDYEMQLKVAGDILVFYMHTNVFEFEKSNPIYKTGYVKDNPRNSYCGIIHVYNFLSDSFKYNRVNDLGYLIARIFVNRESRFFIESKPTMGYRYQNFSDQPISDDVFNDILTELVIYCVDFDLYTPPNESVKEITVFEIQERIQSDKFKTGKRLGFSTHNDSNTGQDINF